MAPLHSPRQIGALFRGEYLGGFNQGGGNALRRSVGQFHLFAAQRLDFSIVDRGGGEGLPDLLTPGEMLLPQRIDIVGSAFGKSGDLLALLGRRIDAPQCAIDRPFHAAWHPKAPTETGAVVHDKRCRTADR